VNRDRTAQGADLQSPRAGRSGPGGGGGSAIKIAVRDPAACASQPDAIFLLPEFGQWF
jgi:hypothetical protein